MRKIGKHERVLKAEYGRSIVALQHMSRDVEDRLAQLYYALQRKDMALVRYNKAAKALQKFEDHP